MEEKFEAITKLGFEVREQGHPMGYIISNGKNNFFIVREKFDDTPTEQLVKLIVKKYARDFNISQ